jgi:hypothetical protein
LAKAAWLDPAEFLRTASAYGFVADHCEDRLVQSVIAYVTKCIDLGESPTPIRCEDWLSEHAVPCDPEELARMFVEVTIPTGTGMAELVSDVIELSEERAEQICSEDATSQIRQWNHWMNCADCIKCSYGERRPARKITEKARRLLRDVEYMQAG